MYKVSSVFARPHPTNPGTLRSLPVRTVQHVPLVVAHVEQAITSHGQDEEDSGRSDGRHLPVSHQVLWDGGEGFQKLGEGPTLRHETLALRDAERKHHDWDNDGHHVARICSLIEGVVEDCKRRDRTGGDENEPRLERSAGLRVRQVDGGPREVEQRVPDIPVLRSTKIRPLLMQNHRHRSSNTVPELTHLSARPVMRVRSFVTTSSEAPAKHTNTNKSHEGDWTLNTSLGRLEARVSAPGPEPDSASQEMDPVEI